MTNLAMYQLKTLSRITENFCRFFLLICSKFLNLHIFELKMLENNFLKSLYLLECNVYRVKWIGVPFPLDCTYHSVT